MSVVRSLSHQPPTLKEAWQGRLLFLLGGIAEPREEGLGSGQSQTLL